MPIKKSELYSSLWASCDELRGGMDASQYKDYVLVLLFVKYVSDKAASNKNYDLDVPKGGGFADMVALRGDKEIGDKLNKIVAKLAEANGLKGVIDVADWNDESKLGAGKEMVDRLSHLVAIFENPALDFRGNRADGDDLLGDAYEYLMRHFATESGKSKGQFYTPAEVSRIMAKVIGAGSAKSSSQTIHDPTCGSGSLLLKAHDEAWSATGHDLALYGQENDNATKALARMNLILHDCPTGEIAPGNTLAAPQFTEAKTGTLKTFDFVVANPPFSSKAWSNGFDPANDLYRRFAFGIPPKKNGDFAFLLHVIATLKSTGKGAIILPHGVLFRGNAEADIRREIVKRGYIKGIIGLPPNLFFGTGIPACIVVLDKEGAAVRKGIFMIDASKGFMKDGPKNRLRAQDIHRIVDTFTREAEIPRYSRLIPLSEVSDLKNDFNLNIPRYIDSSEPEDLQDIDAHLRGGIPDHDIEALDRYWQVIPSIRTALFKATDRPGYSQLKEAVADMKTTIFGHVEFMAFNASVAMLFTKWRSAHAPRLRTFAKGDNPKALIETLSEDLLSTFEKARLLDPYDVYQHLMDYWAQTMQDDCYIISAEGWKTGSRVREVLQVKNKEGKLVWPEEHDYRKGSRRFKCDVIPAVLLIARFFSVDREVIDAIEADLAEVGQRLDDLKEEHGVEGGLLEDVIEGEGDKRKITAKSIRARLKDIRNDDTFADERAALEEYAVFLERQSAAKGRLKKALEDLDAKIDAMYPVLSDDQIREIVIGDKWLAALGEAVQGELDRVSQGLAERVGLLAKRYGATLQGVTDDVAALTARVWRHLERVGAE
jgi:type I restriction enzyme M protein